MTADPEIVGFDLGHGESALAVTRLHASTEPQPIEVGGRTILTAVGVAADGAVVIGEGAFEGAEGMSEAYVRFKAPDLDARAVRRPLLLFVRRLGELVREGRQLAAFDRALFWVGCPSGWGPTLQARYADLMREAGLTNVEVVPESRAAFMHARESRDLAVDERGLSGRVLLVDIGSSTTDFTLAENLNERPLDFGLNRLGAGLIDRALLARTLAQGEPSLKGWLDLHPAKRVEADLKLRRLKERWFDDQAMKGPERARKGVMLLDDKNVLKLEVDRAAIEAALSTPMPELEGMTWRDALSEGLRRALKEAGGAIDLVLLTGGGARMGFVEATAREVLPESRTLRGKEPELAIAKGLAWFGRASLRARGFRAAVEELAGGEDLREVIGGAVPDLLRRVAASIAAGLIEEVVGAEVRRWRDGAIPTLNDLEAEIEARAAEWLRSGSGKARVATAALGWFETVRPQVHTLTDPLCERFNIATTALDLEPDTRISTRLPALEGLEEVALGDLDNLATVVNLVVAAVVGSIMGGANVALLMHGPIGFVVGAVGSFLVFAFGQQVALSRARSMVLPKPLRWLVTDARIKSRLHEAEGAFAKRLEEALKTADAAEDGTLRDRLAAQIGAGLSQRADDAILRF